MEVTGKIIKRVAIRQDISKKTGEPFIKETWLIEIPGQYPRRFTFDILGEERCKKLNIQDNQEYKIYFDIDGREWEGQWYNSINAWKAEPAQTQSQAQPVAQQAPEPAPMPTVAPPEPADNLPF